MVDATASRIGTDRAADVLTRVTTVLAGADLESGVVGAAVLDRALELLRSLPGVTAAGIGTAATGRLAFALRAPEGFLLVDGDPDAVTRSVLAAAADMLGAVLRSRERSRLAAVHARRARVLVESSTDLVIVVDVAGVVVDVNEAAERTLGGRDRLLGRPAVELIMSPQARAGLAEVAGSAGGDLFGLVHPDDRAYAADAFRALVEGAAAGGTRAAPVQVRVRGAGGWRWMSVLGHDLRADPAIGAVVLTLRDVTRQREAERTSAATQHRLANLIDNLTQGVLVEDDERHLLLTNRAFVELFGIPLTPAEMVGGDMDRLLGESAAAFVDPDEYVRQVRARMADRVPVLGDELLTVDDRVLERDFVPIVADGESRGHLWIFRDVTKRKREEERLAEEYQRLVAVTAAKNRFVASVSHELRTPLTSIVSFAGLLSDPESGPLTEEQHDFLEIVERNAGRLIRLVGDLLMLTRLESGAISLEMADIDPADLAVTSARGQQIAAADAGVELTVRTAPGEPVVGDPDRLGQVIDNLLSNAIKFTPAGGRVCVTAVPDGEGWTIEVSDTGIGIPAGEQGRLFTEFYRASNSRTDRTPGTGLGLVISRLIVERHGGDLRLISEEDRGTTAVLQLPAGGRRRGGW